MGAMRDATESQSHSPSEVTPKTEREIMKQRAREIIFRLFSSSVNSNHLKTDAKGVELRPVIVCEHF